MRRLNYLLTVCIAVGLFITGCGNQAEEVKGTEEENKNIQTTEEQPAEKETGSADNKNETFKVGFANVNDIYPYLVKVRTFVEKYGKEEGMEILVADAAGDLNTQIGQMENFISQGVDAVIAVPADPSGIVPTVDMLWENKIAFMTVCGDCEGKDIHVGSENYEAGKMQAEYLAETLPENGKVLYMHADPVNQEYVDRRDGFMTLFEERPDLELLSEQNSKNRTDMGMTVTEAWIQSYSEFDAIVAQNDDSALGAIEALKAANRLDGVTVVGLDGSDEALESISNGELSATAYQDAQGQARALVDICKEIRDGKNPDEIQDVTIPFKVITKENLAEVME